MIQAKAFKTMGMLAGFALLAALGNHTAPSGNVGEARIELANNDSAGGDGTGPKAPQGGDGTGPKAPQADGGDGTGPKSGGDGTGPKGGDGTGPKRV